MKNKYNNDHMVIDALPILQAGASLLWGKNKRIGIGQPGEKKTGLILAFQYLKGA